MRNASSPRLFSALKMGTPLTATAIAPRSRLLRVEMGLGAFCGAMGMRQAFLPKKGWGMGTCCCQLVIPTIMG